MSMFVSIQNNYLRKLKNEDGINCMDETAGVIWM